MKGKTAVAFSLMVLLAGIAAATSNEDVLKNLRENAKGLGDRSIGINLTHTVPMNVSVGNGTMALDTQSGGMEFFSTLRLENKTKSMAKGR